MSLEFLLPPVPSHSRMLVQVVLLSLSVVCVIHFLLLCFLESCVCLSPGYSMDIHVEISYHPFTAPFLCVYNMLYVFTSASALHLGHLTTPVSLLILHIQNPCRVSGFLMCSHCFLFIFQCKRKRKKTKKQNTVLIQI